MIPNALTHAGPSAIDMARFRQHPILLGSTLIIIATLASVTMWDVYFIVDDYIHNNKVTLVTWEPVEKERFQFLENETLEICLIYDRFNEDDTWFHEMWSVNTTTEITREGKLERQRNATRNIEGLNPKTFGSMSSEQRIDGMYVFEAIGDMTSEMYEDLPDLHKYDFLNGVLRDPLFLRELQAALWRSLQQSIILLDQFQPEDRATLNYLTLSDICFDINLIDVMKPVRQYEIFQIASIPRIFSKIFPDRSGIVQLRIRDKRFTIPISPSEPADAVLYVTNQGVFDRQATTPDCQNELYVFSVDEIANQWSPCRAREYVKEHMKICDCIPVTTYRDFEKIDPSLKNYRFCTAEILRNCSVDYLAWQKRMENKTDAPLKCAPACTNVHNQYTMKQYSVVERSCAPDFMHNTTGDVCAQFKLDIECDSRYYVYYVEKPQSTFTQFLGQVGGDIGLYTGLSVLTVWQMFMVLFGLHQKYRRNRASGEPSSFVKLMLREMGVLEETTTVKMAQQPEETPVAAAVNKQTSDRLKRVEMSIGTLENRFENLDSMLRRVCEKMDAGGTNLPGSIDGM